MRGFSELGWTGPDLHLKKITLAASENRLEGRVSCQEGAVGEERDESVWNIPDSFPSGVWKHSGNGQWGWLRNVESVLNASDLHVKGFKICIFHYDNFKTFFFFLRYILDVKPIGLADMLALGKEGAKNSAQIFSSELITCDVITLLTSRLWGEWGGKQMDLWQPWPQGAYSKNPEMSKYQKTYDEEISSTTSGLDVGKWWCAKRNRDQGWTPSWERNSRIQRNLLRFEFSFIFPH